MSDAASIYEKLPEGFEAWPPAAQRSWLAGGLTQLEMLQYASLRLGLGLNFDTAGSLTSRDLALFVTRTMETFHVGDANDCSI